MTKYALTLLFAFFVALTPAKAAPPPVPDKSVTLSFNGVALVDFLTVVYPEILKKNFALHPDLLESQKTVTLNFKDYDRAKLGTFLADYLDTIGILAETKNGYVLIRPKVKPQEEKPKEPELDYFFYTPKYRSASSLIDIASALFKVGKFNQRTSAAPSGSAAGGILDALVFHAPQIEIDAFQKLLEQLDTPVGELLVKGVVYEVAIGARETNAIRLFADVVGNSIGVAFGVVSGNSLTVRTGNLDTVLSALSTDSRFKTITTPSLRVKSGGDARFSVGSDVPVLGSVQLDKNGNPVQSVEYKPSGTIFAVKPTVHANTIDLHVFQQLSTFVQTTTGVNNSPTLNKREITTQITAKDGDLIVLGGLDEDKSGNDSSGISFLPDWMRSKGSETTKTQILLILQVQRL